MAAMCLAAAAYSGLLAHADWLRMHLSEANVEAAIRIDRINPYAYTLRAEYLEQAGKFTDAERAWRQALQWNGRDTEGWMRLALLRERAGDGQGAERFLLRAAEVSRTWLPRWALVNFYIRYGRRDDAYRWARQALERASADAGSLFTVLEQAGASPDFILRELLPRNRTVTAAFIRHQLAKKQDGVQNAAERLAGLIPDTAPGWPGAHAGVWGIRTYPCDPDERLVLMAAVDRLMETGNGQGAIRLWNLLRERGIVAGDGWNKERPSINAGFEQALYNAGLDWRLESVAGADVKTSTGEAVVRLDGHQPESADLIRQLLYLPAGRTYRVTVESRTEDLEDRNGLEWQVRNATGAVVAGIAVHPSEDWAGSAVEIAAGGEDRVGQLVLSCRRLTGAVRAEGIARFRRVSIEVAR